MAKKSNTSSMGDLTDKDIKGFKSFKNDNTKFYELNEGDEVRGVLVSVRQQEIKDKRTKQMKDIMVYRIRQEDGTVISLGGRALLDRQFEDAKDDMFGGSWDNMKGAELIINRGDDSETGEGNPIGTYELQIKDSLRS